MSQLMQSIVASQREGLPLGLIIQARSDRKIRETLGDSLLKIIDNLEREGYSSTQFGINGSHSNGQIRIFSTLDSTITHEEAHREIHKIWSNPDISFDEGYAYALTDYIWSDEETINIRRDISMNLSEDYHKFSQKFLKGNIKEKELCDMVSMIKNSGINYKQNNWASFLKVVENFKYYSIFSDILEIYGRIGGKELIHKSAKIGSKKGLYHALDYLSKFLSFNIKIGNNLSHEYYPSEAILFTTEPVRMDELGSKKTHKISMLNSGKLYFNLWSVDNHSPEIVDQVLKTYILDLERKIGKVKISYNNNFKPN